MSRFVEVAVPLPLSGPLTYSVPGHFERMAQRGVRVRVPVGRRTLMGMVTAALDEAPAGFKIKPIQSVLDREPVLPEDLLHLAQEISKYYLAPIGEVLQAMVPSALPPWGDRQIWLTNAGALALARSAEEQVILAILRERGRLRLSELAEELEGVDLYPQIEQLESEGRVVISAGDRKGGRYHAAVELIPGELEDLEERCGRSKPGRQVVRLLAALDRPASVREVTSTVGCTPAVIRRLTSLGVVRQFTQATRLELGHHWFQPRESAPIVLRQDQRGAVEELEGALESGSYAAFLLAGITGSGKTEVYLRAVAQVVESGGSAVILVPEIALVPAIAGTTRERFGSLTAIFHSAMSPRERQQEWERIRQGEARVVVGPRSAVFTPVKNLKLVIVDEEQDPSYKQDQVPRYHGRDLALLRAHQVSAVAVLVSATPSLETRLNVEKGKIQRLELTERVGQGSLPEGVLVDLRQEEAPRRPGEIHFSGRLTEEMERVLAQGDQIILLRNRRGYAPMLLCRACGEDSRCDECGLPRTLHLREGRLRCHYCGSMTAVPQACPVCAEEALEAIGSGTERVEERVLEMWPELSVDVLDRDTARRGEAAAVLERFSKGESQV
jgi:primosomal protein N' (replication factor Y)